jgi:hypothetical protein
MRDPLGVPIGPPKVAKERARPDRFWSMAKQLRIDQAPRVVSALTDPLKPLEAWTRLTGESPDALLTRVGVRSKRERLDLIANITIPSIPVAVALELATEGVVGVVHWLGTPIGAMLTEDLERKAARESWDARKARKFAEKVANGKAAP